MEDSVQSLIRFVGRSFYDLPYILILDAVLKHSVLSEDDLIHLLSIKRKELRALCYKLVDDRLLTNHIQKEETGQQKYVTRTYFFIHNTEAIDAIKWRVHSIVNQLKEEMSQFGNPQGYVCPRCGKKVSQLDAISLLSEDKTEFICDVCQGVLIEDDSSQQASIRQEKLEKLMLQVDPIISYLKKIDESNIEENDFESALVLSIPAQSVSTASYSLSNRVSAKSKSSATLQNQAARSQATLHVSITANDENYEREQMEREKRRQRLEQNALPSWHSGSTVGKGNLGKITDDDYETYSKEGTPIKNENGELEVKTEEMQIDDSMESSTGQSSANPTPETSTAPTSHIMDSTDLKDKEAQDALASFYAQLAKQEAEEDEEEDDDDDDVDDDEFDDLI
ncbi:large subunit of transcription factor tfIIE [Scheffersomyces coipomensis]|uniref:large subunit of transcription factor tfIIE n=1 Tax=Scheffersomyces coipomensis TaxID=1788519 RepID=UPI00315CFD0B